MPVIETPYSIVDREALEEFIEDFDTHKIMTALDAVDRARAKMDELWENLLLLHDVMTDLVNGASHSSSEDSIDVLDLSEEINSPSHDLTEAYELVWNISREVKRLCNDDAWEARCL